MVQHTNWSRVMRVVLISAAIVGCGLALGFVLFKDDAPTTRYNYSTRTPNTASESTLFTFPKQFSGQANFVSAHGDGTTVSGVYNKDETVNGDWIVSAQMKQTKPGVEGYMMYTVKDNKVYYEQYNKDGERTNLMCLPKSAWIPYGNLKASFENAEKVYDADLNTEVRARLMNDCPKDSSSSRLAFDFMGETFILCGATSIARGSVSVFSENFDATATTMSDFTKTIKAPEGVETLAECDTLDPMVRYVQNKAKEAAPVRRQLVESAEWLNNERDLIRKKRRVASMSRKKCVFVHGSGLNQNQGFTTTSPFSETLGDLYFPSNVVNSANTPSCNSRRFIHWNSVEYGWNDPVQVNHVCDSLDSLSGSWSGLQLYSHSAGGLIIAEAIRTCNGGSLPSNSKWTTSQSPFAGTPFANAAVDYCSNDYGLWDDGITLAIIDMAVEWFEGCADTETATPTTLYLSTTYNAGDNRFVNIEDIVGDHLDSAMCGRSCWGITSGWSAPQWAACVAMEFILDTDLVADGLVTVESCHANNANKPWGNSYTSDWYDAEINHADGALWNGDGWWGNDNKPIQWFKRQFAGSTTPNWNFNFNFSF